MGVAPSSHPSISDTDIVEGLSLAVFVCDARRRFVRVNAAYEQLSGYDARMLVDHCTLEALHGPLRWPTADGVGTQGELDAPGAPGEPAPSRSASSAAPFATWQAATLHHRDGRSLPVQLTLAVHGGAMVVGSVLPQAPNGAALPGGAPAWHDGFHDPWTQLPNAAWFDERAALKLRVARRAQRACAMLVIEIDQMARLRDSLGDEGLGQVMQLCGHRVRGVIGPDSVLATLGGGLLACVLDGDQREAEPQLDALLRALALPLQGPSGTLRLTASVGAALAGTEVRAHPHELLHRARVALGAAKSAGGAQARWFRNAMQAQAIDRLQLEGLLRDALDNDQFHLVFQPQLNLATGRVLRMETLLRWQVPGRGPIGPQVFIPVAEDIGLIVPIGTWVLRQALQETGRLKRRLALRGIEAPRVAVNVSAHQLLDADLLDVVRSALAEAGLGPEDLEIEITESIFMHDAGRALDTLEALRQMGVELAIDDFGTGYSSFSYLTQFPFDRLKIDRSLVMNVDRPGKGYAIVAAIVSLAHALDMKVTAEGMETVDQAEALRRLDCDDAQGYGFARPLAPAALERLLCGLPAAVAATQPA